MLDVVFEKSKINFAILVDIEILSSREFSQRYQNLIHQLISRVDSGRWFHFSVEMFGTLQKTDNFQMGKLIL